MKIRCWSGDKFSKKYFCECSLVQFWDNCTLIIIVFWNIDTDIGNHKHNAHIKQIYYPNPLALWIINLKIFWKFKVIIIYYHMNSLLTLIYLKFQKRMWHNAAQR